jgi:hypothetical protein
MVPGESMQDRSSFESGQFDGGALEYRVNGGTWNNLSPSQVSVGGGSYNLISGSDNSLLGLYGFVEESTSFGSSYVTSTFTLGTSGGGNATFSVGNQIEFRFHGGWDSDTLGSSSPNWQIGSLTLNNLSAVPEPEHYAMVFGAALLGFAAYRRVKLARA